MSIWGDNTDIISKRYPQYSTGIRKAVDLKAEMVPSKEKLPSLKIDGKWLYDPDNPIRAIAQHTANMKPEGALIAIFLGLGIGYDPLYYYEHIAQAAGTEHILIIEPDYSMARLACQNTPMRPMLGHPLAETMLGVPPDMMLVYLHDWLKERQKYNNLRAVKIFYNPELFALNEKYYNDFLRQFPNIAGFSMIEYGNDPKDSLIGFQNMLANVDKIIKYPGINLLKDAFKNRPAVIVSTGPSLDKNKHLLQGLQDKAVIIAADASLRPMLNMGVKPHIVCTLEREMAVCDLFQGITAPDVTECWLAGCPVIYSEVYDAYPGEHIITYRNFDHFKWLGIDRGILDIKLSAGNMAFKIAEYLGCNPIILIGQDLALAEGKTNADGAVLGTEQDSYLREPRLMVKGNYCDKIETTRSLKSYLDAYIIDINDDKSGYKYKGKVINATEGGAHITGTEVMTFTEAIQKYLTAITFDPVACIKASLARFVYVDERPRIIKLLTDTTSDLDIMADMTVRGIQYVRGIQNEVQFTDIDDNRLQEIETEIKRLKMETMRLDVDKAAGRQHGTWQGVMAHFSQAWLINFEAEIRVWRELGIKRASIEGILAHELWFYTVRGFLQIAKIECEKYRKGLLE